MIIYSLVLTVIGGALIFLVSKIIAKKSTGGQSEEISLIEAEIEQITKELEGLLGASERVYSKGQLNSITQQLIDKASQIETEHARLLALEKTLEELQNNVEARESKHQEMKSTKEEDEIAVEEFLERYPLVSDEAISLEQQIAQHMKHIDKTLEDPGIARELRPVLTQAQEALQTAGSSLRTQLMEFQSTKERLDGLQGQHRDLEDEYTKLVEQQLGG